MATKKPAKVLEIPGDSKDVRGFPVLGTSYFDWMRMTNCSPCTIRNHTMSLVLFAEFLLERGISHPVDVTRPMVERYQRHLFHYRKKDGEPLSFRSQRVHLDSIRSFFRWLMKQRHILANPASDLDLPKMEYRLPPTPLTPQEAERILSSANPSTVTGVRDRAMLEVLYSTGIRRMELSHLRLQDIDAERGTLMVRQGKGKRDRMIPIGERALSWVKLYLETSRPKLAVVPDQGFVFLTVEGVPFLTESLTHFVRDYIRKSGLEHRGACHLFRHTMATGMLENGADIRFIQQMLGHVNLKTTEIYTHVSIRALKEVHTRTHPARMTPTQSETPSVPDQP